jgi:hypothetical protein
MENGQAIVVGSYPLGDRAPQAATILPSPSTPNQYYLFNVQSKQDYPVGEKLFYNRIDMSLNGGLGKVVEKKKLVIQDSINWGQIKAVQHANGRDWWIVLKRFDQNKFYKVLLSNSSISTQEQQISGEIIKTGGQVAFSPDGSKYIAVNHPILGGPAFIDLFDFDRCSGELSNRKRHTLNHPDFFVPGVSVSPDSRFLYITFDRIVYQYDLRANNIFASEVVVAEFDTNNYYYVWPLNFYLAQLAPDGRIYVSPSNGNFCLHRIRYPNKKGLDCQFRQWDIYTPTGRYYDLPNHPNYRLGSIDGSTCDTLGLDNHPLARFRWDFEDTISPLRVTFGDLSTYEPDQWTWYFGDGTVLDTTASGEVVHTFPSPGTYTVCLVAANGYSSDTVCHTIKIAAVSATEPLPANPAIAAYPNPSPQDFTLHVPGTAEWQRVDVELSDIHGRVVLRTAWRGQVGSIGGRELHGGVYFARVTVEGMAVGTVKLVKI